MARKPRYRLRYTFWLNHLDKDEELVADTIERLKTERNFATVVRDGIMICAELRQGKIDLLLRLYPWVTDMIKQSSPSSAPPDTGDMERIADRAAQQAAERVLLHMPSLPATPLVGAPIKPAAAPPKVEIKQAKKASADEIANNFLLSF